MWRLNSVCIPAVKRNDHVIVAYFYNSASTRNSSSSTASALKPNVCGSSIAFSFHHAFSSCDQSRFAINKAGQLV